MAGSEEVFTNPIPESSEGQQDWQDSTHIKPSFPYSEKEVLEYDSYTALGSVDGFDPQQNKDDVPHNHKQHDYPCQESQTGSTERSEMLVSKFKSGKDTKTETENLSDTAQKICDAVSDYYETAFAHRWQEINAKRKDSKTNCVIAALVKEEGLTDPCIYKVVVLAVGTKYREECPISENTNPWHLCDGHAEGVCYHLTGTYFKGQILECNKKRSSIFEETKNGFKLKEGIAFHFFVSHPPCGFMRDTNESKHLSWKIFKGKPHVPKCSSKILINSFLGIQGPVSHLLEDPVYIKSVVILNDQSIEKSHIETCFQSFENNIKFTLKESSMRYSFHKPHICIVDKKPTDLFQKSFKQRKQITQSPQEETQLHQSKTLDSQQEPVSQQKIMKRTETSLPLQNETLVPTKQPKQPPHERTIKPGADMYGGSIPDTTGNSLIKVFVWTTQENAESYQVTIENLVKNGFKSLGCQLNESRQRIEELHSARKKLYEALKVGEALKEESEFVNKKLKETQRKKGEDIDKLSLKLSKIKTSLDEFQSSITKLKSTKSLKEIDTGVKKYMELENCIKNEPKPFQDELNASLESLKGHSHYLENDQELQKLQCNENIQELLDILMGCEWISYMKTMYSDCC